MTGRILAVCVAGAGLLDIPGRGPTRSAIDKRPVEGRVAVARLGLAGDVQVNKKFHGGEGQAVYAYAQEDADHWSAELGRELPPGRFGENLRTAGLDLTGAVIGERWRVGTVELEVCQPRLPCHKLAARMGEPRMVKRFAQASRPGAYLRIVREGMLGAGDAIELLSRPDHGITVRDVSDAILLDETLLARAASAPELPRDLAAWMLERAA